MAPPDPEPPLVYSLYYAKQGCQDWDDELPSEAAGRMKKQKKGKSNHPVEGDFCEKLESWNLDPRLTKLMKTYQEVFGLLCHPCHARSWSRWTSNSNKRLMCQI